MEDTYATLRRHANDPETIKWCLSRIVAVGEHHFGGMSYSPWQWESQEDDIMHLGEAITAGNLQKAMDVAGVHLESILSLPRMVASRDVEWQ